MDNEFRRVERQALAGDPAALLRTKKLERRSGLFYRDYPAPFEQLSEWEEAQADYDDSWWHASTGRKCGLWGGGGCWRFWDIDFRTAVFKSHLRWGHYYGGPNSKRQTIRTHRDGSRKNYRLR